MGVAGVGAERVAAAGAERVEVVVGKKDDPSKKVWVGNIPEGITQEEIAENFKQAGTVVKASLTTKTRTGIIHYSTAAEAKQAIAMFNGSEVGGATLHVDEWTGK